MAGQGVELANRQQGRAGGKKLKQHGEAGPPSPHPQFLHRLSMTVTHRLYMASPALRSLVSTHTFVSPYSQRLGAGDGRCRLPVQRSLCSYGITGLLEVDEGKSFAREDTDGLQGPKVAAQQMQASKQLESAASRALRRTND